MVSGWLAYLCCPKIKFFDWKYKACLLWAHCVDQEARENSQTNWFCTTPSQVSAMVICTTATPQACHQFKYRGRDNLPGGTPMGWLWFIQQLKIHLIESETVCLLLSIWYYPTGINFLLYLNFAILLNINTCTCITNLLLSDLSMISHVNKLIKKWKFVNI